MDLHRLTYLLDRAARLTPEEAAELQAWYRSFDTDDGLIEQLSPEQKAALGEALWSRIDAATPPRVHRLRWLLPLAACLAGAAIWYGVPRHRPRVVGIAPVEIPPGKDQAYLRLANGSVVPLDSAGSGLVAIQGGVRIRKPAGGELEYQGVSTDTPSVNTLTTPKGGQYRLRLPDGTMVWLNAASTLTYPTVFTGNERRVALTGEAYFEVAGEAARPFRVQTPATEVTVLGTRFNLMAYTNEPREVTTLLAGVVAVRTGNRSVLLHPGEQAEGGVVTAKADTAQAVAWKNGLFQCDDVALAVLLRQAARWYDIDVTYPPGSARERFHGRLSRHVNLSQFLKILELNGVSFTLTGKTLTIR
ncbi:MAG TPA: FecR domain-containing protein [Dinghuibacter sp.]|uniref:FecR family protein n=1 Tax=Dinghuibacter sp. TaxID=2024697 RepID=UPI002CCBB3CA|nr:FecR domain-containing protein [Dinghuibacter sp.]HTJ10671.1 FecR domain-containing protein [Dinghuibacter sp.]